MNVLAVRPQHRGKALGGALLTLAETIGKAGGCRGMSVIVADANEGAFRLYERFGYRESARRAAVRNGWPVESKKWILMTRDV